MPKAVSSLVPYWQTSDGNAVRLYHGNCLDVLGKLPSRSVQCVVTSPPYWGLRAYAGVDKTLELGSEETPEEYVAKMVDIFREVRRVLRSDGTVWLNLGDSYSSSSNLIGIPWRVAFALQADGWTLRQDIIWCLSGGTWVYVRSQKGDMPMMVSDMARLDPSTVKLWNGEKWTQVLGMSCSQREGGEMVLVLRSGERIACTPTHKFPTNNGLLEARYIKKGYCLQSCMLPEPDEPRDSEHIGLEAAWFAGLYLAEGSTVETGKIQLSGHSKETERWERVKRIVESYGGSCTLTIDGNNQSIRVYGKVICAIVQELVSGKDAKTKGFSPVVWRYSNAFLESYMEGYLHGDAHVDPNNDRWRLGFTRNYALERDLRTACARLGWTLTLNMSFATCGGERFPSFRGEIRKTNNVHWNMKDRNEVVATEKSRCREVWSIGVEDEPHLFSLASGILTSNSKPNPMPESVQGRCTKSHEYIFLLTQGMDYWYDGEAIKEAQWYDKPEYQARYAGQIKQHHAREKTMRGSGETSTAKYNGEYRDHAFGDSGKANKRSVWMVTTGGYPGAHFATFPVDLILPCIKAGTSEYGACVKCGTPWDRVVEKYGRVKKSGDSGVQRDRSLLPNRNGIDSTLDSTDWSEASSRTVGWRQKCNCDTEEVRPCIVLDPFIGSGTTAEACISLAADDALRACWGIDLSEEYLTSNAIPRVEGALLSRPGLRHLVASRNGSSGG